MVHQIGTIVKIAEESKILRIWSHYYSLLNMLNYIVFVQSTCVIKDHKLSQTFEAYRDQKINYLIQEAQKNPTTVYDSIEEEADFLTQTLCYMLRQLSKQQLSKVTKKHKGLNLWWLQHQAEDQKRSIKNG